MPRPRRTDLQIRGFPVTLREKLRRRAVGKGLSMSQYVIEKLETDLATPTIDEWLDEVAMLPKVDPRKLGTSGAELVREGREERLHQILGPERSSTRRRRSRS
jgi:hypothetical protein